MFPLINGCMLTKPLSKEPNLFYRTNQDPCNLCDQKKGPLVLELCCNMAALSRSKLVFVCILQKTCLSFLTFS